MIEMARRRTDTVDPHCDTYKLATQVTAFEACIDDTGWTTMETFTDIGNPPPPAYFWDILAEVAQVRLHDGGLAEGDGNVEFTLRDVEVSLDQEGIIATVKENIRANPKALAKLAERLNNNADGDADFYYYRPDASNPADLQGDYLYFITEDDLRTDADGAPVRPFTPASTPASSPTPASRTSSRRPARSTTTTPTRSSRSAPARSSSPRTTPATSTRSPWAISRLAAPSR
ncbi:MAG: hypothetical protein IPO88_18815 [Nannocystis sp.]|uniref:hypothetical protein n=1 Tax=Nannocystis sp. TaxID=1962667 RepID=UPI002422C13C|nr:hypothetical protein [Nannocystis sp.]MBK9755519.1 hypothetical protein [Nannocystis sp.]